MSTPGTVLDTADRAQGGVVIDFLFLDLTTCDRCVGTDEHLTAALDVVQQVLEPTGRQVQVRKHLVATEEQARRLRFLSSPTLRVNGRDIAVELKESSCGSESCADGCGAHIDCRVWTHEDQEFTAAPVGLIVDAVLREVYSGDPAATPETGLGEPYDVPENLRRFFRGQQHQASPQVSLERQDGQVDCCGPELAGTCCAPSEKASCCGSPASGSCGCQ